MESVIKMHGTGHNGRLPPVVERASSGCAGHGGDGKGIARRREGFWFKDQRAEKRRLILTFTCQALAFFRSSA